MPRVIPAHPVYGHPSEGRVVDLLRDQLADDCLVVVGQRVSTAEKEHEVDALVAMPGAGIVAIEIKSGQIAVEDGRWVQGSGGKQFTIDPVTQCREALYALRGYVSEDPRWPRQHQRWTHLLVFPNASIPDDFALPQISRDRIVDRDQLDQLASVAHRVARESGPADRPFLAADTVDRLAEILGGRGLPQRDVVARAAENADIADALTREQSVLLRAVDALPRVEIRGGAGSGKTYLALEQARRLSRDGQRVALICYSHGLASYLRRVTNGWKRRERPAYVGEFHALGVEWGAPAGPDERIRSAESVRWWEEELPRLMSELADGLPDGRRFDAVIVDEAQDFADSWWQPVIGALRDRENGRLMIVGDVGQSVFQRAGRPPVDLVPLVLDHNLRNTRQIASAFLPLVGHRMELRGGSGPAVRYVDVPEGADPIAVGDDEAMRLLDEGWEPGDVALLTIGSRHPMQVELQEDGNDAYWETFWSGDDIFYGHVLGFKGLERRAVVLVCNGYEGIDRLRERIYVGLSRATDVLVVVGEIDC
ncbi:NERD domain-containing protein [Dietzia cinnamea]|uniref:Superfamily I DNA and RNA helicase n=1 Tax=Dietzia cinnamea TaxID=321318 RepID=A0A4R3ZXJ0_9ACTN|nr:NERD domain-containing protein [Dietzia cinnamea]TCW25319.1 superfamily I DNA and RNA helicase [Dietzia cinnamea]